MRVDCAIKWREELQQDGVAEAVHFRKVNVWISTGGFPKGSYNSRAPILSISHVSVHSVRISDQLLDTRNLDLEQLLLLPGALLQPLTTHLIGNVFLCGYTLCP